MRQRAFRVVRMDFMAEALQAFSLMGHDIDADDCEVVKFDKHGEQVQIAIVSCRRCSHNYTFDSDANSIIGGDFSNYVNAPCPQARP